MLSKIMFWLLVLIPMGLQAGPKLKLYFFYRPECENCQFVKDSVLPQVNQDFSGRLEYLWLNVDEPDIYKRLTRIETYWQLPESDYPIIFFSDTVLGSREEVEPSLYRLIQTKLDAGLFEIVDSQLLEILNGDIPASMAESSAETVTAHKPINMIYFTNPKCKKCSRVEQTLELLTERYPALTIQRFNDKEPENIRLLLAFDKLYQVDSSQYLITPALFVGDSALVGDDARDQRIQALFAHYASIGAANRLPEAQRMLESQEDDLIRRFESFGIAAIVLAGLFDGINPCAFTTIIFFISYLGYLGRKKRDMLIVGTTFTFSVFLTYFLIGLGTLKILIYLQIFSLISRIIIGATGLLAVVLSLISMYNYYKVKKGSANEIALQLPDRIKQRIHRVIREKSRSSHIIIGAFVIGFFVSIFELACTGQVYLPTITFVVHHPAYQMRAVSLLFLYNLLFIVPLIVIFLFSYWGMTSDKMAIVWKNKLEYIEIVLAIVFLFLGGWLIYSVII